MLSIWLAIAPIFGLIVLGLLLRRGSIPSGDFWDIIDRLVYWVLMPSLLFYKMSTAQFEPALVGSYSLAILGAFASAVVFSLVTTALLRFDGAVASSILQGIARHNTFIALAVSEQLYGVAGLELAILAAAILIPVTNLSIVPLIIMLAPGRPKEGLFRTILRDLVRNPILLSIGLGLAANFLWGHEIPVVHGMTKILGDAALPIILLTIGASLRLREMSASAGPLMLACFGKLIVFPAVALTGAYFLGLTQLQTVVMLLLAAAPTATSSYTFARQLKGDAPLMAAIVAVETLIAFATLPLTIALIQIYWV